MLKQIRQTFLLVLLGVNLLIGIGLLLGAYGQYFSPLTFPYISVAGLTFPFFLFFNLICLIGWLFLKKRYAWISVVLFLFSGDAIMTYFPFNSQSSVKDGNVLKVLTYNVELMQCQVNHKGKSVNPIMDYLKDSKADIVCLQEFPVSYSHIIKGLKSTYPYSKILTAENGLGIACFSKHRILSGKEIEMDSPGNGAGLFKIRYGKKEIPLIIVHLESNKLNDDDKKLYEGILADPKHNIRPNKGKHLARKLIDAAVIRATQAEIVADRVKKADNPYVLVCGDFNDIALSYPHRVIADELQDVYRETSFGPGVTYNQHYMFFRIDHILAGKGYRVLNSKIDRFIDASDHYPFWCELEVPKDASN